MADKILPTLLGVICQLSLTTVKFTSIGLSRHGSKAPSFTRAFVGFIVSVSLTTSLMVVLGA